MAVNDTNPFAQTAPTGPNILEQWNTALQDPGFRASLMSFGAQLMQPMGWGQTPGGHLAQAIGAGGEAATALEQQELKEQLARSRIAKEEEATDIARGRLRVGQENAATRRASLGLRAGGSGGVSATTLFRNQASTGRQMQTDAQRIARDELKAVEDSISLTGRPPPGKERLVGKTAHDLATEYISDPQWVQNWQKQRGAATAASVPPPQQRVNNQVYNTPSGPRKWIVLPDGRAGWSRDVIQPGGAGTSGDEDED